MTGVKFRRIWREGGSIRMGACRLCLFPSSLSGWLKIWGWLMRSRKASLAEKGEKMGDIQ